MSNTSINLKDTIRGNAATATKFQTARTINGFSFDGSANININRIYATDDRDIKPSGTPKSYITSFFASKGGLTGSANGDYVDLLVLNSWANESGGLVNALAFDKSEKQILHYQAAQDATTWGTAHTIAYTSSNVASATTATNVKITETNSTGGTWYCPTWVTGKSGNLPLRANDGLSYYSQQGTTSAAGRTILSLGNSTASGTANNKYGEIWLYGKNTGKAMLLYENSAPNAAIVFPAISGISLVSSNSSTKNVVAMSQSDYNSKASSLPNGTLVAVW